MLELKKTKLPPRKTNEAKVASMAAVDRVTADSRKGERCQFMGVLGCTGSHPLPTTETLSDFLAGG
jgi:hypothetical protein